MRFLPALNLKGQRIEISVLRGCKLAAEPKELSLKSKLRSCVLVQWPHAGGEYETTVRSHTHFCLRSFCGPWFEPKNMSQVAMNIAATTGPITKPLRPKIAMPPSVEMSTT